MAKKTTRRAKPTTWAPRSICKAMDLDLRQVHEDYDKAVVILAERAVRINPANMPVVTTHPYSSNIVTPLHVALVTSKWWHVDKKEFVFGWLDSVTDAVADRIVGFASVWSKYSALKFRWTRDTKAADFRVAFARDGYWSYIGVDCASIPQGQPTMNLEGMNSMSFPDSEGRRVIPHETFHGIGAPHEHSRTGIINKLDPNKTIKVFLRDQGWSAQMTRQQVLTAIPESALYFATEPDEKSIMCYWFTGECTKSGQPIVGGSDLSDLDKGYAAKVWPSVAVPPPIDPPTVPNNNAGMITIEGKIYKLVATQVAASEGK